MASQLRQLNQAESRPPAKSPSARPTGKKVPHTASAVMRRTPPPIEMITAGAATTTATYPRLSTSRVAIIEPNPPVREPRKPATAMTRQPVTRAQRSGKRTRR